MNSLSKFLSNFVSQLFLCSLLLVIGSISSAQQNVAELIAEIESGNENSDEEFAELSIEELLEEFNTPGVSIAVIQNSDVQWAKGYGLADVVSRTPVTTSTMFQAASISKPVNAMAVLKSVEDGYFTLDQDINDVLTSWQLDGNGFVTDTPVTIKMLSAHVAGLGDGFGFPGYPPGDPLPTLVQIFDGHEIANVGPVEMARPPNTAYHYSGGGSTILQQALLDTYNKPYSELLDELVLSPIGMNDSTFQQPLPPELESKASRAHNREGDANNAIWHVYPEQAAAGLWTTPTDLAKLAIEVQLSNRGESNKVLSQEMISEMLSPVGVGPFAVGFQIDKRGEGWYFSHGGSNFGFQAQVSAHMVNGYGYAIMTNASLGRRVINELSRRIEEVYSFDSTWDPVPR